MRISIKEASKMMNAPEQFVRLAIQQGKIQGAFKIGNAYFITSEQVEKMMKGETE